jgi:membrane-associated protease RseP (regulator of RpoE activity)
VNTLSRIALMFGLVGTCVFCLADEKQNAQQQPQNQQRNQQTKEAYLGVSVATVPSALRSQMPDTLPADQGILVESVAKDSPASKAGLHAYDILLTFGEQKLSSPEQLVKLVRSNSPGQTIDMSYLRSGRTAKSKVTLGENPHPMGQSLTRPDSQGNPNVFRLFPDERFQRLFEENEVRNGDRHWSTIDSMKLMRLEDNHWNAEIEYRTKDGKKESKKFTGTRQEIRKQIQDEKDLPDNEKHHLLRALNLQPPIFEFQFPPIGNFPPDAGVRP